MVKSTVKRFNEKSFGLLLDLEISTNIFVNLSAIQADSFNTLNKGAMSNMNYTRTKKE